MEKPIKLGKQPLTQYFNRGHFDPHPAGTSNDPKGEKKAASGNPQIPDTAKLTTNRGDRT
ncbi:MAG TPA: hypothetical protein PKB02_09170 [Anaerohalosphaeraceae bacterium]|nr:hypothetical protein [Anaerohalosphaeraceae bacterium]